MALTPGGAAESLDSNSKEYILTLNRRRQFIKMALETGYKSDFMGAFLKENSRLDSEVLDFQNKFPGITPYIGAHSGEVKNNSKGLMGT